MTQYAIEDETIEYVVRCSEKMRELGSCMVTLMSAKTGEDYIFDNIYTAATSINEIIESNSAKLNKIMLDLKRQVKK